MYASRHDKSKYLAVVFLSRGYDLRYRQMLKEICLISPPIPSYLTIKDGCSVKSVIIRHGYRIREMNAIVERGDWASR